MPHSLRFILAPLVAALMLVLPVLCCCGAVSARPGAGGNEPVPASVPCCLLQRAAAEGTASADDDVTAPVHAPASDCDCGGSMTVLSERDTELAPPPAANGGLLLHWPELAAAWAVKPPAISPPHSIAVDDPLPVPATLRSLSVLLLT